MYPYQKHIWVTKEIIRREYLQNIEDGIYDEQQARLSAESELSDDITAENSRAVAKENELSASIASEVTRATAAEVTLQNNINTANAAIATLESDLSDEVSRAEDAEGTLSSMIVGVSSNLTDEIDRAVGVETTLTTNLDSEISRATLAESGLTTNLSNEISRATTAETDLRNYVDRKISTTYRPSGSIYFADLPPLEASSVGNVYDIKDAFTTTSDFLEGAGKYYGSGQNVDIIVVDAYIEVEPIGTENPSEEAWYEYNGSNYILSEDTTVDSEKTYYRMGEVYKYDVMSGFVDLSSYIQNTDYASTTNAGVIKIDGTTATVDTNGVLHAKGENVNFCGLRAEWNALTNDEKDHYDTVDLLDD